MKPILGCIGMILLATAANAFASEGHLAAGYTADDEHENLIATPNASTGSCGVERWSVKTGTDADVGLVNLSSTQSNTITTMRSWPAPNPIPPNNRVSPYETTVWVLNATLVEYKLETDSDYHLVIKDASGNTMIAEIPDPACVGAGSPFASSIQSARAAFDAQYTATTSFQTANIPVQLTGVGMFDFLHGQTGVAPNGIELHPVLNIVFNPSTGGSGDFALSSSPASVTMNQGTTATTTITDTPSNGFSGNVALSASGLPSGVTASFSPSSTTGTSTLTFTANSTASVGAVAVTITGQSGTLTHTTTVNLTVSAAGSGGSQTAVYNSTLKAPWCATVGSGCDSGPSLLLGRANLSGGAEPNQPNTINNSCADGTSGTFHSDESNDRLSVTTTDGSPLAPGKSVTVAATVWAYSNADALDLYSAADATNPSWVFLSTITPSASGAQTLSTSFTLPSGNLQAIRANFRYQGSASPCSTGSYDDHDDLIFAVSGSNTTPDFTIAAAPVSASVTQGSNTSDTISITSQNGFTGNVALSVSGLPSGVTASFNPSSTAGTSTLTLNASSTAATGTSTLTITGTSGSLSHSTTLNLTVNASSSPIPRYDHVVVVMEENTSASTVIGNTSQAPYINSLAAAGANFTQSFAVTHPSQPNYVALFSGSTQGLTDDSCPHTFTVDNLGNQLITAGFTFSGYSETMPSNGYTGCTYGTSGYARKHAPWVNFSDLAASTNLTYASFPTDFTTLPTLSFVIPNLCDDMHDCSLSTGDTWLKNNLDAYVTWAKTHNSLLILTWDEDDSTTTANQIATIFAGANVKVGNYSETINHYSILRTLEDMYGLGALGSAATATPITDVWSSATAAPDFSTASTASSLSLTQGTSGSDTVTIASTGGFSSAVNLTVSGLPSGVTGTFSPATVTPAANGSANSTLTLTASAAAATGTSTVTVTGTSGSVVHSTTFSLTINATAPAPDFALSATPTTVSVTQGASTTATITETPTNGFTGSVALSASGLPSGVTASFNPTSTTGSSTLTLTASSAAATGAAMVTITGTSGSLIHTTTLNLTVNASATPNFALSASPAAVNVTQGSTVTDAISITGSNGFSGSVALSASGLPSGVTASFNPSSATGTSTLTLNASSAAATGTTTLTITGNSGSLTRSTTVSLTVNASGGTPTQLLGNTSIESALSPWTATSGVDCSTGCSGESAHTGTGFAWLDGYGSTHTDTLSQTVTIPAGKTSGTLQFYLHIDTAETSTTTAYDKLSVKLGSTTLATFSNLNAATGYQVHSYNVSVSPGSSLTLTFTGTEDSQLQTSFVIDDVTFTVQ